MAVFSDTLRISWSIYWKSVLTGAALGAVFGAVLGFVIGFVCAFLGASTETIKTITGIVGVLSGLAVSFLCLNFFLANAIGKKIGHKQLIIEDV